MGEVRILVVEAIKSFVLILVSNHSTPFVSLALGCLSYLGRMISETVDLVEGINGGIRDETLLKLTVPTMFVQGSKDSLCPLEKLEATRKKMEAISELHIVDCGDHSFKIGKKHLQSKVSTQQEAEDDAVQAIAAFVSRVLEG